MKAMLWMKGAKAFVLVGLLIAALGGCGSSGASELTPARGAGAAPGADQEEQLPNYTASVQAPDADAATLASLARITEEQAQAAALKQVPGTVVKTELDNENGNLVYSVEIQTATGEHDVKVDAGNGRVLLVEADDGTDDGEDADSGERGR
jgi:hypothetical protein